MEEGKKEGITQTVRGLKLAGVSLDIIIKATGLSKMEIGKL